MIQVQYVRGPGFVALISNGHAETKEVCEAECAVFLAAALAIENMARWHPREIAIEGLAHTGPRRSITVTADTKAVPESKKWRKVR